LSAMLHAGVAYATVAVCSARAHGGHERVACSVARLEVCCADVTCHSRKHARCARRIHIHAWLATLNALRRGTARVMLAAPHHSSPRSQPAVGALGSAPQQSAGSAAVRCGRPGEDMPRCAAAHLLACAADSMHRPRARWRGAAATSRRVDTACPAASAWMPDRVSGRRTNDLRCGARGRLEVVLFAR
jgi:hypothetical protein